MGRRKPAIVMFPVLNPGLTLEEVRKLQHHLSLLKRNAYLESE